MNSQVSAQELYRLVHQRPFQPFRIHLQDGRLFDIRFPSLNMVLRETFIVGIPPKTDDPDPIAVDVEWLHIPAISRVEILSADMRTKQAI